LIVRASARQSHGFLHLLEAEDLVNLTPVEADHDLSADIYHRNTLLAAAAGHIPGRRSIPGHIHIPEGHILFAEVPFGVFAVGAGWGGKENHPGVIPFLSSAHNLPLIYLEFGARRAGTG
jgi:hypothetical protein